MATFGERLRSLRIEKDYSMAEFAKLLHAGKTTISNWENDNRFPDRDMLIKLADFFNVSVDYLIGRADNKQGKIVEMDAPQGHVEMEVDRRAYPDGLTYEEVLKKLEAIKKLEEAGFQLVPKKEEDKK